MAMSAPAYDATKQSTGIGRPCALTDQTSADIIRALRLGATIEIACGAAGVGVTSFYRWTAQGRTDDEAGEPSIFRDFWKATEHARHRGDLELLASVKGQTQGRQCRTCAGSGTLRNEDAGGRAGDRRLVTCAGCKGSGFATTPDGRLALELLSRRHPEAFGRKDKHRHEHTGKGGGPVRVDVVTVAAQVDLVSLSAEQLAALAYGGADTPAVTASALPPARRLGADVIEAEAVEAKAEAEAVEAEAVEAEAKAEAVEAVEAVGFAGLAAATVPRADEGQGR